MSARRRAAREWSATAAESARLALDGIRVQPLRSGLATLGVVIGIVTVVLVASVLANVRNQIALLFRELGTENVFAYHRSGDPYQAPSEDEADREPLEPAFAEVLAREGDAISRVGVQVIVPPILRGRPLIARAAGQEADSVLVEGASPAFFDVVGAEFQSGRPFTDLEDRAGARVAILGADLARALFGTREPLGETVSLGGDAWRVVGVLAPRPGGFFGVNRQDRVMSVPAGTAARRFPEAEETVLYARAAPERREDAYEELRFLLRRLRGLAPAEPDDFNLSTSDRIIGNFDRVAGAIGLVTLALAAVSLAIGGIGVANVMIISVQERTREIGVRRARGPPRREVLRQFLLEAALLSAAGGLVGVGVASLLGFLITLVAPGFSAVAPGWAVAAGLAASVLTGVVSGYWPARRAAALDPIEALRYE